MAKLTFSLVLLFIAYFLLSLADAAAVNNRHSYLFNSENSPFEFLDPENKAVLSWSVNDANDTITFELEAETLGWVGFGISPTGGMTGADIFIAGVDAEGNPYFSDRHAVGKETPIEDIHADWTLIVARELPAQNKTYLKFSRLLDTCDDQDYPIGIDTNRIIWALGSTDEIEYHGPKSRGTKSISFLGAPMPEVDLTKMLQWNMTLNMEMPVMDTSYWCSFHKGPKLNKKHHVVAFDSLLTNADAIAHTHHFILYNCYKDPNSDIPVEEIFKGKTVNDGDLGDHCYRPWNGTIPPRTYCQEYLFVWAKGGKKMVFPEKVGYPIGGGDGEEDGKEAIYMLEIHYDNPQEKRGVVFETGVQFYYTNETRENEAGLLMIGHDVNPSITIPPNVTDFVTVGHCGSQCTQEKFPTGGVKVFNSLLHSHISGRKLKLRQFRDGVELPWPDYDNHYDFDFQQNKHLGQELIFLPGDHFTYECTYDTVWKGEVVIGDLGTRDEMCQTFVWHYPRIEGLDICGSTYPLEQGFRELGITDFDWVDTIGNSLVYIKEPKSLEGDYQNSLTFKYNWTKEIITELQRKRQFGIHEGVCFAKTDTTMPKTFNVSYPNITVAYEPENVCQNSGVSIIVSTGIFIFNLLLLCMRSF